MSPRPVDLLVVDDHRLTRTIIGEILSALDRPRIRFAEDGAQAVEEILLSPPDIAVVDFHMPFDGLALLDFIRRGPKSPDPSLPVIVMTGMTERRRIEALRDGGADEIIVKPFTAKAVLARIAAVIDRPRPFIVAPRFVGPDRRRLAEGYDGPPRRSTDVRQWVEL